MLEPSGGSPGGGSPAGSRWAGHAQRVGRHGQGAVGVAVDEDLGVGGVHGGGQTGEIQRGDEVIRCRYGTAEVPVRVEGRVLARVGQHPGLGVLVEALRPVEAVVGQRPVHAAQVVHHVAARHDQHTAPAQWSEPGAELKVVVHRLVGVDAELDDGNRRVRKGVHQHRPGAVVDSPAVDVRPDPGRVDDVTDLLSQFGQSRRRVLHVEQLLGKPVEVVNGPRSGHRGDGRGVDVPVGADHQDRAGTRHRGAEGSPRGGVPVDLEGVHRVAVAQERRGHQDLRARMYV